MFINDTRAFSTIVNLYLFASRYTVRPALAPELDMSIQTLEQLANRVRDFGLERDWQQFHTPKNLTAALIVEAAELLEPFQWMTPEESLNLSAESHEAVRQEMADVLIYLVSLANCLNVDLLKAAEDKLALNAKKYPASKTPVEKA